MSLRRSSKGKRLATLTLSALGVVYGDIGTSPLYALKEVFGGAHHPVPMSEHNILGILSLVFWALMIVVSLKYVVFIMRADNKGEGGIMALMALVLRGAQGPGAGAGPDAAGTVRRRALLSATARSRRRFRCSPRSRASKSPRPRSSPTSFRSRSP